MAGGKHTGFILLQMLGRRLAYKWHHCKIVGQGLKWTDWTSDFRNGGTVSASCSNKQKLIYLPYH